MKTKNALSLITFLIIAVAATPSAAREIVGVGDFQFYLDSCAFRGKDGKILQEIYIRIPNNELKFKEGPEGYRSRVKLSVSLEDLEGRRVIGDAQEMEFTEANQARTASSLFFQTIIKRYHIPPGQYFLSVAAEDLEAPKVSIVGIVKGRNKLSAVRDFRWNTPDISDEYASFSQSRFVWLIDRSGPETVYHPNPPRLYGLHKDTLTVFLELYLPDSLATEPTFEFQSVVTSDQGETMAESSIELPNPINDPVVPPERLRTYPILIREDVNTFPAGAYSIVYYFGVKDRVLRRVNGGRFSVAWDIRTWEVPRRDFMAEARFLLGDDDYSEFILKSTGEQEQVLDKMWRELDPSPETGVNEAYEKFLVRLSYVNDHFAEDGPGILTDRGRIYMSLGHPSELIEDVIPVNRESLSEAMALIEDRFHAVNYSTHGVKRYGNPISKDRVNAIDPRGLSRVGEGGNTGVPYEVWIYQGRGDPIFPRDDLMQRSIGSRYLFVDHEGYGKYVLEATSDTGSK